MMDSFGRMARRSCNECGSSLLQWTTAAGLLWLVPVELRARVIEGARFFGNQADAWKCGNCSNFGIFGPTEMAF